MNAIRENYRSLDKSDRPKFRQALMNLFKWETPQTFYRKLLKDYQPTGAEEKVSEMIVKDINSQK